MNALLLRPLAILVCIGGAAAARQEASPIRAAFQDYVDRQQTAGTVTLVARKGKVVSLEAVGWQDREANKKFFAGELQAFSKEAAELLLELGIIKTVPDIAGIIDTRFIR